MSGRSFPLNAVSGGFGLASEASNAAGKAAGPMARMRNRARRSMNHPRKQNETKG
jgi:hypothetical protein